MMKNLTIQKDERILYSIICYPTFKSILKDNIKNLVSRLLFSLIPGVVTPTRYAGKIDMILTNKNLYLEYSQDEYNSILEFTKASTCISLNEIENISIKTDEYNEIIDILLKEDFISVIHPNIGNKRLGSKIANYIISSR